MGYSIDLCEHIVAAVKNKLQDPDILTKYVRVNASTRFEALSDNSIDILCGATTKTLSRSEIVDFTQHTFITGVCAGCGFRDGAQTTDCARSRRPAVTPW